jgi:hypothetical protein
LKLKIFGKSPYNACLRFNEYIWKSIPENTRNSCIVRVYGALINSMVRAGEDRRQYYGTFFLRNRPELDLITRIAGENNENNVLSIAVLGCSNGAEVYSILFVIRKAYPNLCVKMQAVDISIDVLNHARNGVYTKISETLVETNLFERMTESEKYEMFDHVDGQFIVKSWIKQNITWHVADAGEHRTVELIGKNNIVVANNFLCHMPPIKAENCLRNIAEMVDANGYLFVSGIDVDVRARVAKDLRWRPIPDLLEDIHDGDPVLRNDWPLKWWGLEPLNKKKKDWNVRYASSFQVNQ